MRRAYVKPRLRKTWTVEWIGMCTVIGWAIFIGSFIAIEVERDSSARTQAHAEDVIENLRRLPATLSGR